MAWAWLACAGGEHDGVIDHVGVKLREGEREHAAHAAAGDGVEFLDAEEVQERTLGAAHVVDGDDGKIHGVRFAGGGIGRARAGGTFAAAEDVGADDEVAVGIEGEAGPDHEVPPAGAAILMRARDVGIAAERVEDQDGVGLVRIEVAPRLVGDRVGRKRTPAIERQWLSDVVE